MSCYRNGGKRILDIAVSGLAGLALAPVMVVVSILVALRIGRPILFRQVRPGLGAKPFTILKFRTMIELHDKSGKLRPDEERLTGFGRRLRSMSVDELPELWNVLRGEMSLVGPRPLLMEYLDRYTAEQARRHQVSPGITGWAQIHGRNQLSWERKFAFDLWYVDNLSLWLDLKILAVTARRIVTREGISAEGHATMPKLEAPKE